MRIKGADIRLDSDGTIIAPGGGGSLPVDDATAVVKGSVDPTKLVRIEADGLSTATTRVITMPDQNVDLTPDTGTFPAAAHATRHQFGGSDAIKLDDLAAPDDNTDRDATASLHGLMPKLDKAKLDTFNAAEATVASATTTDLGALSSVHVSITGTTTITGFGTVAAGTVRSGRFTGALTLTHNGTSLILPGGANITTAAGDRFGAISLGSGNWCVYWYTKADGTAIVGGGSPDAAAVTYTPTTNADWDSSTDPGNVDDALDQLAERTKDLEGASSPLNNHAASAPPTASDDSGDGYSVGSVWTDTTLDEVYQCADSTAGDAVWNKVPKRQVRARTLDNAAVTSYSYVSVPGFTFSILANKDYYFDFALHIATSGTGVGVDVAVNGPSSPTLLCYEQVYWTSATARTERCATAYDNNTASTGSNGTAEKVFRVRGVVRNGSNAGSLTARVKVENASGGNCTVKAGSFGVVERLAPSIIPPTLFDAGWFEDAFTDTNGVDLSAHTPTGPNTPSGTWGTEFYYSSANGNTIGGDTQILEVQGNAIQVDGASGSSTAHATPLAISEADCEVLIELEAAPSYYYPVIQWLTDYVDANNYEGVGLHYDGNLYTTRIGGTAGTGFVADFTSLGAASWPLYMGIWHVGTDCRIAFFNAAPPAQPVFTAAYTLTRTPAGDHGLAMENVNGANTGRVTAIYVQPAGAAPTWEAF